MDKKETRIRILKAIEHEARVDIAELAVRLGMDQTDILNEMNEMEKEGVICGYLTLVDWDKTDEQTVTALIEVRCTPQRGQGFDVVAERIYKFAEVNSVYLISGGFDLLITIEGRTLKEISRFVTEKLSAQEAVLSCATHFILRRYKDHGTILAKKYEDERQLITP
ncbi:MAG: Lrp/AsnC family transcriptional regulator [Lachnospiraceae bacterium]|nr:Lrp/AsnC family transcriptional regulator [Lachnospiraceae bacterium]